MPTAPPIQRKRKNNFIDSDEEEELEIPMERMVGPDLPPHTATDTPDALDENEEEEEDNGLRKVETTYSQMGATHVVLDGRR